MKTAFQQENFVALLLVVMLFSTAGVLHLRSYIYFAKDILRMPLSIALQTYNASFLGFTLIRPFWANIAKKYGNVKTFKLGAFLVAIVLTLGMWITTLTEAIIFSFLGGFVAGSFWITLGPVAADINDEITTSTGKHQEATYEAFRAFFNRLAFAFVGIIIPLMQIITGYNTDPHAVQTPLATWGIRIQLGLIPSLLALTAYIIMKKWYDREGEKQVALKKKLKEMGL